MRRIAMVIATAGVAAASLLTAQTAGAASTNDINNVATPPPARTPVPVPKISALDCAGTTGWAGCGPGWIWRDGWRGFACYVC